MDTLTIRTFVAVTLHSATLLPSTVVAVIVAVPVLLTAVTTPFSSTVATDLSVLSHTMR